MNHLRLLLSLAIGFAIGYIHTGIAIVMLFRPFEEFRFLGLRLQGMIPRRKAEMARSVARIFTSDLLREETVAERIAGPEVRRAFEALSLDVAGRYLDRPYGSLRDTLGPAGAEVVTQALEAVSGEAAVAVETWLSSPAGRAVLRSGVELLLNRTPAELLPGEEAGLSQLVAAKGAAGLSSPDLAERLRGGLLGFLPRLAQGSKPLGEILPAEARCALSEAVRRSVPAILQRFEQVLVSAPNVEKIKGAVRSGVRAYLLEMQGGLLKSLVRHAAILGRDRIFREVDAVVDANLYRLRELVYEEENRAHLEAGVWEALEAFLSRTPAELLDAVPAETLEGFATQAAAWAAMRLRQPDVAEAFARFFERELTRVFRTPLRELAALSGAGEGVAERLVEAGAAWAAGGGLESLVAREEGALVDLVLGTPIGRPSRFLGEEGRRQFVGLTLDHLMPAVAAKVPEILRIVDVEGLIEREVLGLSPRALERVIVAVAKRELGAIAWWGGALGALIGGVQSALQRFVF